MARKNRPTLKGQYSDYIARVAPFDGNVLIQKTEDDQVTQDLFDSLLNNTDSSDLLNSPSAAISLDFAAFDLHRINSSGSGGVSFNITINNLGTGQVARIHITKKNNDTYDFTNAIIANISNLSQKGTTLTFYIHNINGALVAFSNVQIEKSDLITGGSTDQLATGKAVSDLKANLEGSRSAKVQVAFSNVTENFDSGSFNSISYDVKVRETDQGVIQMTGFAEYQQPGAASPFISLGLLPAGLRPNRTLNTQIFASVIGSSDLTINTDGTLVGGSPGNGNTSKYDFNFIFFIKTT